MKVSTAVLDVLENAAVNNDSVVLVGNLDRKLYVETNKVLEAAGGKWNKSRKAHIFDGDAAEIIDNILIFKECHAVKSEFGQFDTPVGLAARLAQKADIKPGMKVLEPSAGVGNLVREIVALGGVPSAYEIDDKRRQKLDATGLLSEPVGAGDFLSVEPQPVFDRVLMNPPFAKQADINHVQHAFKFLKPGGKLVSVMAGNITYRSEKAYQSFRNFVAENGGVIENLPDNSFKESGTSVSTCVVTISAAV